MWPFDHIRPQTSLNHDETIKLSSDRSAERGAGPDGLQWQSIELICKSVCCDHDSGGQTTLTWHYLTLQREGRPLRHRHLLRHLRQHRPGPHHQVVVDLGGFEGRDLTGEPLQTWQRWFPAESPLKSPVSSWREIKHKLVQKVCKLGWSHNC